MNTALDGLTEGDIAVARNSGYQAHALNYKGTAHLEQVLDRFNLLEQGKVTYDEIIRLLDEALDAVVNSAHFLREARKVITGYPHSVNQRNNILENACRQAMGVYNADPDEIIDGEPAWKQKLPEVERQFSLIEQSMLVGQAAAKLDHTNVEPINDEA